MHDVAVVIAAPLEGPTVRLNGKPGRNEAELVWTEIPQQSRQGFITNYTIFYASGTEIHSMYCHVVTWIGFGFCIYSFLFVVGLQAFPAAILTCWFLFCTFADKTVPANVTSYTLTSLSGNTKYDAWVRASTIQGSTRGSNHSFTTLKYGEYNLSYTMNCSSCVKNVPKSV